MPSLSSIFHHKSHSPDSDEASTKEAAAPPPLSTETTPPTVQIPLDPSIPHQTAPQFAPGTGPTAHAQMHQANNAGMLAGGVLGIATGGNPAMDMVEGQVGANILMQRIQQEQKHQYYREQALNYKNGLSADGVCAAGGLAPPVQSEGVGRNRNRSRSQSRDERRKARWERRAKRRDGGGKSADSSGSESG